jgi:adenine-specific DNA-methyltransferase
VIKGENHHVLEALLFTHAGKVDCIYIDPPYNTGVRDWKYDNDYVDENDDYRHSKWLAFMERRLKVAKKLLNQDDSVLIIAIDEKEYLRLGLLLEQMFPTSTVQMVTSVVKPEGTGRVNEFSRTNEFLFFVMLGASSISPSSDNMYDRIGTEPGQPVEWRNLRRRERSSTRGSRKNQFYAVFVEELTGKIQSVGEPLPDDVPRTSVVPPEGTRAVFPMNPKGEEMIWSKVPESLRKLVADGHARTKGDTIQFLNTGTVDAIQRGKVVVLGHDEQGAVIAEYLAPKSLMPKTVWARESHNTQTSGTLVLSSLLPGRDFPSPKSLYAVEDAIRFFVKNKPNAIVLDFFGGSGTTTHAVARLNRQDGGQRQSILVTNNEVAGKAAKELRDQGHEPGDTEWEARGIFENITLPRITSAMSGLRPDGKPVPGKYKFNDEFPMSDGLHQNVEFFELTYEDPARIELDLAFQAIAPLLWLRSGSVGSLLREQPQKDGKAIPFAWTNRYGVLFAPDAWRRFVTSAPELATTAFIVTDSTTVFSQIAGELAPQLESVRLYERYLTTFAINIDVDS